MLRSLPKRLFYINSSDSEIQRKGRLLHFLVILVIAIAASSLATNFVETTNGNPPVTSNQSIFFILPIGGLHAFLILWLTRKGRVLLAAHLFTAGLNLTLFVAMIMFSNTHNVIFIPYMMLVGIVIIASLDKISASIFYTVVTATAVTLFFLISDNFSAIDIMAYLLTLTGVCTTFWITASDLKNLTGSAKELTKEVESRAQQLQLSAEVSQKTSLFLDLESLLLDTVNLIQEKFGYYCVSIFLPNQENNQLFLKESTGIIGAELKKREYQLPIDETSIVGWVATHQRHYVSHNVNQDPIFRNESILPETQSELGIPLIARGKLLGILDIQSQDPQQFQEDKIAIMQIMASQVAVNIDNAQLFTQTELQLNETQTLLDLNTLLTTTLEVGEIYRRAAREFAIKMGAICCGISSWDKESGTLTTQAEFIHDVENSLEDKYITNYESFDLASFPETEKVLKTHLPQLFFGSTQDQIVESSVADASNQHIQHVCIELPLVIGIEALGTVKIYRDTNSQIFTQQEIQLLQAMSNQTAIALNNAILTSNTRGQLAQFSSLHRMSAILSQASNLKEIFDGARREILSLIEATGMSISLLTEDKSKIHWIYGFEFGQEVDLTKVPLLSVSEGFTGEVIRRRAAFYVSKADELSETYDSVTIGADLGYWLGLPLIATNELIGVLAVENDTDITNRDIELLKTIAGPLAIAINNFIQFDEIQTALKVQMKQRIQLETAADVAATATSVLGVQDLTQKSVDLIKERFELYYVGLFLVDKESNHAVLHSGTGRAGKQQIAKNHQLVVGGQSLIGGTTHDGNPRIIQDVHQDNEWFANPHLPDTRSELALPLRVRGQIIGALTVQSIIPNVFDPDLLNILQTMTDQLAIAIENARLLSKAESEAQDQQLIHQVSSQFHQSVDVHNIVKLGLETISQRLGGSDIQLILGTKRSDSETSSN